MQILLVVSVGIMLMSMWIFLGAADHKLEGGESLAIAEQMSLWHRGAHDRCVDIGCGTGVVNPGAYLSPVMQAGDVAGLGYFVTRYDAGTNLLVTYMPNDNIRGGVTYGLIAARLHLKTPGQTSQVGSWNAAGGIVEPNYTPGYEPTSVVTLSSPFAGATIADGSPVIVSRLVP